MSNLALLGDLESPDLRVAADESMSVLLNQCDFTACPADLDGSGDVGFADLLSLLAAWGPYDPCPPLVPADIDENCEVGFSDLLALLAAWGLCP